LNARSVLIGKLLLVLSELHDVNADFAVARAFAALDVPRAGSLLVILSLQNQCEQFHVFRQRAPVAAPHLPAEKWIERNRNDADQPRIGKQAVSAFQHCLKMSNHETVFHRETNLQPDQFDFCLGYCIVKFDLIAKLDNS
jgi:hypothetical protein